VTGSRSLAFGETDGVGQDVDSQVTEIGDASCAIAAAGLVGSVTDSERPNAADTIAAAQSESRSCKGIGGTDGSGLLFAADENFIDEDGVFAAENQDRWSGLVLVDVVVADHELNVVLVIGAGKRDGVGLGQEELTLGAVQWLSLAIADADAAQVGD